MPFIRIFCSLVAVVLLSTQSYAVVPGSKSPNFVVIVADDLGASDLGAYGHPVIKTPNIDGLAKEGVRFTNAFFTTASCSASRASILASRYPFSTGAPNLHQAVPASQRLVSSYLHDAGYYTAAIGKWHLGEPVRPQFDRTLDVDGDSTGDTQWVKQLRERPKNKPFFFWLASKNPHVPYEPLKLDGPYQPADAVISPLLLDTPAARMNIAQYYTEISHLDQSVGKVMQELKAQGVLDNTYVIFLSDNGAPMPRAKTTLYDAGIKTPLIIRGPHVLTGKESAALVSSIDVMPTILALARLSPAATMQGLEFTKLLAQPQGRHRDLIFAEQHDHGFHINKRAVRSGEYLYIRNIGENKTNCILEVQPMGQELAQAFHDNKLNREQSLCFIKVAPEEELYAVKEDPLQLHNLAADSAKSDVRKMMRKALDEQAKKVGDDSYF